MNKKYLIITIAYAVFVLWISIQPITQETPEWFPYQDKVVHIILYTILSNFLTLGMIQSEKQYVMKVIFSFCVLTSFSYGLFIEICQIFVPTRSFEVLDLLANLTGSLIGVILIISISFIISELFTKKNLSL